MIFFFGINWDLGPNALRLYHLETPIQVGLEGLYGNQGKEKVKSCKNEASWIFIIFFFFYMLLIFCQE
jgi:hypothetical protein